MGNRDKKDQKVKKPKKGEKATATRIDATEVPAPVEVVRKKRKEALADED